METLNNKQVVCVGLVPSQVSLIKFLGRQGAFVRCWSVQGAVGLTDDSVAKCLDIPVETISSFPEVSGIDIVIDCGSGCMSPELEALFRSGKIPVISPLELGFRLSYCLNISVSGAYGKSTTSTLLEHCLNLSKLKTLLIGDLDYANFDRLRESRDLDFAIFNVSLSQLAQTRQFHSSIAVLLNLAADSTEMDSQDCQLQASRLFEQQQQFDWAVIQSEVLAGLKARNLRISSKIITFSAENRNADIYYDRGVLWSRIPDWSGFLVDMDECSLGGIHHAENIMACLAVCKILHIPLDFVREALRSFQPLPSRFETLGTVKGVQYIDDGCSMSLDSLHKSIMSVPHGKEYQNTLWLVTGGDSLPPNYHDIGPLLSQKVKGAIVFGASQQDLRSGWSLFTPCIGVDSPKTAFDNATGSAVEGDVILYSPLYNPVGLERLKNREVSPLRLHFETLRRQSVIEYGHRRVDPLKSSPL
ncbi:MAG TPA: hypothetical protein EYQ50_23560 [Verrucomicrobiales bacterium]|nr:hypothetical protein [Verrucomicrobiales bacterium]HIL71844.1 hypothetical protein [Verrucomicrobiota bacterium]